VKLIPVLDTLLVAEAVVLILIIHEVLAVLAVAVMVAVVELLEIRNPALHILVAEAEAVGMTAAKVELNQADQAVRE
jgi:hypothetical protein